MSLHGDARETDVAQDEMVALLYLIVRTGQDVDVIVDVNAAVDRGSGEIETPPKNAE